MKSIINVDVPSFYQSEYKVLSWIIEELTENGLTSSVQMDSTSNKEEIQEAIKDHIDNIIIAIQENGDIMDYEVKLSFNDVKDGQKDEFFETFYEHYTGKKNI